MTGVEGSKKSRQLFVVMFVAAFLFLVCYKLTALPHGTLFLPAPQIQELTSPHQANKFAWDIQFPNERTIRMWRKTTLAAAVARFSSYADLTCRERFPPLLCPPPVKPPDRALSQCAPMTEDHLGYLGRAFVGHKPLFLPGEYVYDWEKELFNLPPLTDVKRLPDMALSRISPLSATNGASTTNCDIGQTIHFRVDLIDGYGANRKAGGDDVRAWVVQGDMKKGYRAAASVKDKNNGSYVITAKCLWQGTSEVRVSVSYPREYLKLAALQKMSRNGRYEMAYFTKATVKEPSPKVTGEFSLCSATPNIPSTCLCNLTKFNRAPYYCGRPVYAGLDCDDLKLIKKAQVTLTINATLTEMHMLERVHKDPKTYVFQQKAIVNASNKGSLPALQPCNETPFSTTWTAQSPNGFFKITPKPPKQPGSTIQWESLICKTQTLKTLAPTCLKDMNIIVYGDSNGLRMYGTIIKYLKLVPPIHFEDYKGRKDQKKNVTCVYYQHEKPIRIQGLPIWRPLVRHDALKDLIDGLPAWGTHVVIVHYYLHLAFFHMSVLEQRLEVMRDAIIRATKRNPHVYFGFRGPHVAVYEWSSFHETGGDVLIRQMLVLMKNVFWPVREQMVFLDGWDTTVALENRMFHPINEVPESLMDVLFSFVCQRKMQH